MAHTSGLTTITITPKDKLALRMIIRVMGLPFEANGGEHVRAG
jgi:hypothetical protein